MNATAIDPPSTVGLLYSGGLDSAILALDLVESGRIVQPIYIGSRLHWEDAEFPAARNFLEAVARPNLRPLVVLELPLDDLYVGHWSITGRGVPDELSPDEAVYLPGRNPLLIVKARMWCQLQQIHELALGCLSSNPFADASPEFFAAFGETLDRATSTHVKLTRPFADWSKRRVMQRGRAWPLELTFSCIQPPDAIDYSGWHCGRCNKCAERQAAFAAAEIVDRTRYAVGAASPLTHGPGFPSIGARGEGSNSHLESLEPLRVSRHS